MKAVLYDKRNSTNALVLREIEKPIPRDNEVLVKICAVSVNAADYRSMKMGIIPKSKIFGADIAGRVDAVGENASRFAIGDEVFGDISAFGFGGFAEYVAVPETALAMKPTGVTFETAAAVPMAAVTALQALRDKGQIQCGQKVLICGAGGGVGTFSIQLAKYYGTEVTAVCGEKNVKVIQSLGADDVINYKENDFTKCGKQYDLILAINGSRSLFAYKRLLAPKGVCVIVGGSLSQVIKSLLFGALLSIGSKKMRSLAAKPNTKDLEFIIKLVANGKVQPVIDRHYLLHETAEAVQYLSGGHALGKVIIEVASAPVVD
ncbi:NAD(P)-dependent alcohol dehydrogenase [Paenibacillus andongensis]|uniref:NAD(P)-dependent alcohol dehydrogenase n=1 Tax=Paenibacillus andongensis TaxID=2975482 RepID=UPI0021BA3D4B|nr:NAD(P)-dependent alcohol dehydrogenase [Paenibacillus andongensis]